MAWFTQSRQASEAISQMIEYKLREEPAFLYLAIARCPVCTCMCGVVWCVVYTVCCDVRQEVEEEKGMRFRCRILSCIIYTPALLRS